MHDKRLGCGGIGFQNAKCVGTGTGNLIQRGAGKSNAGEGLPREAVRRRGRRRAREDEEARWVVAMGWASGIMCPPAEDPEEVEEQGMAVILLHEKVPQAWLEGLGAFLREHSPEGIPLALAQCDDAEPGKAQELLKGAHVLVAGLLGQKSGVGRETLAGAPELRLVLKVGSRIAGVDLQAARDAGVQVALVAAPAHVACAEHAFLLVLALAKKLMAAHSRITRRSGREGGPEPRNVTPGDYAYNWANLDGIGLVAGKTLGLVGIADIAVEVARRARAFGMKVIYCDRVALPADEERELGVERRELDELLGEADAVSLHVALGPETANLINAERLAKMKPTALLVNTARGGLVDEAALAEALEKGRLAGAALDAWAVEPASRDNLLLKLDNVVATPHVAAGTLSKMALFEAILPSIVAALKGEAVARSLTAGVAPKPALPLESPPPAPAPEPAPEAEAPKAEEAEPAKEAEAAQEKASEEELPRDDDTPPTMQINSPA